MIIIFCCRFVVLVGLIGIFGIVFYKVIYWFNVILKVGLVFFFGICVYFFELWVLEEVLVLLLRRCFSRWMY